MFYQRQPPSSLKNIPGWPWTEESPQLPPTLPNGFPWPKISIVTPSFNQAQYLEETIRSVLLQGYPNLEYIIIDGGSTDGSVDIIKLYAPWLAYWVSEPDRGQSHAINKGFSHSTGEIMAWINSDDYYAPNAFHNVVKKVNQNQTEWIAGRCYIIETDGGIRPGQVRPKEPPERWFFGNLYDQPGIFWKRTLWEKIKGVDESLHYSFDYDLWMQFSGFQSFPSWTDAHLANFRLHVGSKTVTKKENFIVENQIIQNRYKNRIRSRGQKTRLWLLIREKKANENLTIHKKDDSIIFKIIVGLYFAPWYIFRIHFYYRIKVMLMARKRSLLPE